MAAQRVALSDACPPLFAGIDVGGTSIKIGVVDDRGGTLAFDAIPTHPDRSPDEAIPRIDAALRRLLSAADLGIDSLLAVGLGSPGTMDIPAGRLLDPPNLPGWCDYPLRDRLQTALGLPVSFANDAGAAAYGEYWLGSGRDDESIVLLTLGTGVGGGIIVHGRSIDGQHSHGSECGHIIIDSGPQARSCSCGQPGHLEAYASATAVVSRTLEALAAERPQRSPLHRHDPASGGSLTALHVAQAAEQGDALSLRIIDETAVWLGIGITTLAHTIDPAAVILGGAMHFGGAGTELGDRFLQAVTAEFQRRAFPVVAAGVSLRFASLGSDAGYLGAAGIARQDAQSAKGATGVSSHAIR